MWYIVQLYTTWHKQSHSCFTLEAPEVSTPSSRDQREHWCDSSDINRSCNSPFRCGRSREGGRLGRVPGQTHPGGRPRHRWGGGRRATPGAACSTGAGPNQGAAPDLLSPPSKSTAPAPSSPSAPAACWTFHLRWEPALMKPTGQEVLGLHFWLCFSCLVGKPALWSLYCRQRRWEAEL